MANEITVTDQKIKGWLVDNQAELTGYAARRYDQSAWMRTAMLAIVESNDLRTAMTTEAGRISLHHALRRAASLGLSLNPQEGKSCLVPYKGKIQYQVMKDGYIDLALDTGAVKSIKIDTVYEADEFQITETNNGDEFRFSPARKNRGKIDGFFASMTLTDGTCSTKWITAEQAIEHRKKYSQYSQLGEKEYGEKTVAKMLCKSSKVARLAPIMEIADQKDESETEPEPINVTPPKGTAPSDLAGKIADRAESAKPAQAAEPEPEKMVIGVPPADQKPAEKGQDLDIF